MDKLSKIEILQAITEDVYEELQDEEIIHQLLSEKVSHNTFPKDENLTFGQRQADAFARLAGSWGFIIGFIIVLIVWIVVNVMMSKRAFDPYPFILLNLVLSCIAAVQAPLIMMSQNRVEQKDRETADNDYKVNLKTEIIISDIHDKLDRILENQEKLILDDDKKTPLE